MYQTRNTYRRNSSWNAPYTFSGKEKDVETGYGYFGARYYDSGLSIWLSVDPMSDKYPSLSPYNYCANNPIILVDPDGRAIELNGLIENINKLVQYLNDFIKMDKVFSYNKETKLLDVRELSKDELNNLTQIQKKAYDLIYGMIRDPFKMAINVEGSSESVSIANFYTNSIDIDDILKVDELASGAVLMGMSLIVHEFSEQMFKQKNNISNTKTGYYMSDMYAVKEEEKLTGYTHNDLGSKNQCMQILYERSNPNELIKYQIFFIRNNVSRVTMTRHQ